jgi:hypothetical protein
MLAPRHSHTSIPLGPIQTVHDNMCLYVCRLARLWGLSYAGLHVCTCASSYATHRTPSPVIQRPGPIQIDPAAWIAVMTRGEQPPKIVMPTAHNSKAACAAKELSAKRHLCFQTLNQAKPAQT